MEIRRVFDSVLPLLFAHFFVWQHGGSIVAVEIKYGKNVDTESRQLLSDYLAHRNELIKWCGDLTMTVNVHGYLGPESQPRERCQFLARIYSNGGKFFRIDEDGKRKVKRDASALRGSEVAPNPTGKKITILRPDGLVVIGDTPSSSKLYVENIEIPKEEQYYRVMSDGVPWCIHSVMGAPMTTFVVDPPAAFGDYSVDDVKSVGDESGRTSVQIDTSSTTAQGSVTYRLLIDRESGVLREFRISDTNAQQSNCGRVEYKFEDVGGRIPAIKRYVTWAEVGKQRERYNETDYEVSSLSLLPASLEVFDPASLGLAVTFPKSKSRILWLYLAAAGVVCVSVYVFGRRRRINI